MTDRTLTALYDTRGAAETARDQLVGLGVSADAVSIRSVEGGETPASSTTAAEDQGFWASLGDLFMPDDDRHTYAEGMRRGGYLLTARVPDDLESTAMDILEAPSRSIWISAARLGGRMAGPDTIPEHRPAHRQRPPIVKVLA